MPAITLTQGKSTVVDDPTEIEQIDPEFAGRLRDALSRRWFAIKVGHNWYAMRSTTAAEARDGQGTAVYLHRFLLGLQKGNTLQADHADRDSLNNSCSNLRRATRCQNKANGPALRRKLKSSSYKGVTRHQGKWYAKIRIEGNRSNQENKTSHASPTYRRNGEWRPSRALKATRSLTTSIQSLCNSHRYRRRSDSVLRHHSGCQRQYPSRDECAWQL